MTIAECRKQSGISVAYISDILGVSVDKYTYYENNPQEIPINVAIGISRITGVSYDDIFFG